MPVWNRLTAAEQERVLYLYRETAMSTEDIAKGIGCSYYTVFRCIHDNLEKTEIAQLKKIRYSLSKLADKNPMLGQYKEAHHNYKGGCLTKSGYKVVLKPTWYTSRKSQKHVFEHHVVVCENLGLTEIPRGYNVHHCNGNKLDNKFTNLVLISAAAHTRLHAAIKRGDIESATTISKESTLKWVEAHGGGVWHR